MISRIAGHLNELLCRADHPGADWNVWRRAFAHRLLLGLIMAGDTMLTSIVRHFPNQGVAMRYRYKAADRMLGEVDLVPVAAQQPELLGKEVDDRYVIALDLSDIAKKYATKMECLATIYDGSAGDIHAKGFGLVTATALDLSERRKAMPIPLLFEVFSSAEEEFVSQPHIWLEAIDTLCAATPGGVIALDREGDNGRIIKRLCDRGRSFVIRLNTGESSRNVLVEDATRPTRVRDAWKDAPLRGELICERLCDDGSRTPYQAEVRSCRVRLPKLDKQLWLCVFDSQDHPQPLVLLTSQHVETLDEAARVLTQYFARWTAEEMHRFAKQAFKLENIRLLTWQRLKNMVAILWIALGALRVLGQGPQAEHALQIVQAKANRVRKPLTPGQFWGYTLLDGLRAILQGARALLRLVPALWPRPVTTPQLSLPFGGRA